MCIYIYIYISHYVIPLLIASCLKAITLPVDDNDNDNNDSDDNALNKQCPSPSSTYINNSMIITHIMILMIMTHMMPLSLLRHIDINQL